LMLGEKVLITKGAQGVLGIHLTGVIEGRLKGHLVWFKAKKLTAFEEQT
jgi:hypothetical protein